MLQSVGRRIKTLFTQRLDQVSGPRPEPGTRVIIDSLPKSGTHLLAKLVAGMGFQDINIAILNDNYLDFSKKGDWDNWEPIRAANLGDQIANPARIYCDTTKALELLGPNQFCISHLEYKPKIKNAIAYNHISHLFIIRDLRDNICSMVDHRINLRAHAYNPDWYYYLSALSSDEDRLITAIEGRDRFLEPFASHLDYGAGWVDDPDTLVVRFEDLIGPSGGGEVDMQKRVIAQVAEFLGLTLANSEVDRLAATLWGGNTRTMNRGQRGSWDSRFTPRVEERFWEIYGPYMECLGYRESSLARKS